jgi:hypothetical protein
MSLEASAPSAQPSEQPAPQSTGQEPAAGSAPTSQPTTTDPASATTTEVDWRARMAGSDAKAIETLSRYGSEGDLMKAFMEQRTALSKRAEPMKLADNASPEQVAEYRKSFGVPHVPNDAKPEAYIEAYKITPPNGYAINATETGLIAAFAKRAYEAGHPPKAVNDATNFFFQEQAAADQAMRKVSADRQKEWTNSLRDELGSKEFEAQAAATEAWVKSEFADDKNGMAELLNAQLPGGGRLGDHPWAFKQFVKLAMGNGFTDRIEANTMESGGRSLADQQREIEALRSTDSKRYGSPEIQDRYTKILDLRHSRGEIDEQGRPTRR